MGSIQIHVDNGDILNRIDLLEARVMGVVKEALTEIRDQLKKVGDEYQSKLDALAESIASKGYELDEDDKAAIAELKNIAQGLDDKVADAVTTPLPDPPDSSGLDPAAPDVIDPGTPVDVPSPDQSSQEPGAVL